MSSSSLLMKIIFLFFTIQKSISLQMDKDMILQIVRMMLDASNTGSQNQQTQNSSLFTRPQSPSQNLGNFDANGANFDISSITNKLGNIQNLSGKLENIQNLSGKLENIQNLSGKLGNIQNLSGKLGNLTKLLN